MKIQYCSDLHLEFAQNTLFLQKNPIKPVADTLILAGDITLWGQKNFKHWFFDYVSEHWERVYYIPGNHEFYSGKDIRSLEQPVMETIRENVFLVNNQVISMDNCDLFLTALWSHIPDNKSLLIEAHVSDFHLIKYHGKPFKTKDFNKLHAQSIDFLRTSIPESKADHKIIVSHHVPSQVVNPEIYKNSDINPAFVSEQKDLILELHPDYWIYGHHHANMPETEINGTKLVTNQLGYVQMAEHHSYRNSAVIEIE